MTYRRITLKFASRSKSVPFRSEATARVRRRRSKEASYTFFLDGLEPRKCEYGRLEEREGTYLALNPSCSLGGWGWESARGRNPRLGCEAEHANAGMEGNRQGGTAGCLRHRLGASWCCERSCPLNPCAAAPASNRGNLGVAFFQSSPAFPPSSFQRIHTGISPHISPHSPVHSAVREEKWEGMRAESSGSCCLREARPYRSATVTA